MAIASRCLKRVAALGALALFTTHAFASEKCPTAKTNDAIGFRTAGLAIADSGYGDMKWQPDQFNYIPKEAYECFKEGAEVGDVLSTYYAGAIGAMDYHLSAPFYAKLYLEKAIVMGHVPAMTLYGDYFGSKIIGGLSNSAFSIATARSWYEKAMAKGDARAFAQMARIVYEFDKNPQRTRELNMAAYNKGYRDYTFMKRVEAMLIQGVGGPVDWPLAMNIIEKAAREDLPRGFAARAQFVGAVYVTGRPGVPVNYAKAMYWLKIADAKGFPAAAVLLSSLYREGRGVPKDLVKARQLLEDAAKNTGNKYGFIFEGAVKALAEWDANPPK